MKCFSLKIIFLVTSTLWITHFVFADPLLVIVLMVKNEEAVIQQTIMPYLKVDPNGKQIAFVIFDTGSRDKTIEKAVELFAQYPNVTFAIGQQPFVNFAVSRNAALRYAEEQFPDAVFLANPDAEWYINNLEWLLQICEQQRNSAFKSFLILIKASGMDFYLPRIMRAHCNMCFKGVVHEWLDTQDIALKIPEEIFFEYPDKPQGFEKSKARWKRDASMLYDEHWRNPEDPRTIFYLAQSYDCLGELLKAYQYYKLRTQYHGFDEEDYMASFRLGKVIEILSSQDTRFTWDMALSYYLNAFAIRPTRAEPLILIAGHYLAVKDYEMAFLYSFIACQIAFPNDILFVEKNLYEHVRYEIMAKASLLIDMQIPRSLYESAIKKHPSVPQEGQLLAQVFGIM